MKQNFWTPDLQIVILFIYFFVGFIFLKLHCGTYFFFNNFFPLKLKSSAILFPSKMKHSTFISINQK